MTPDDISRLSPDERLTLIAALWDSLEDEQVPLTAGQITELDQRLATLDDDRADGVTWDALKAELTERCP